MQDWSHMEETVLLKGYAQYIFAILFLKSKR